MALFPKIFFPFIAATSLFFSAPAQTLPAVIDFTLTPAQTVQMNDSLLRTLSAYNRVQPPNLQSLLIVKEGKLVFEEYYLGYDSHKLHNIKSCTKSITSLLVGIAFDQGYLKSTDQKLYDFFPEYFTSGTDPRTKEITIQNLLRMGAGFRWAENGWPTWKWVLSKNWARHTINLPLAADPGTRFIYNTSDSHLLSVMLTRATGLPAIDFAKKNLFGPLDIKEVKWKNDPQGNSHGGSELHLLPRDMAKIGYMVLNKGQWNGKQIVSEQWIKEATSPLSELISWSPAGKTNVTYGYQWWGKEVKGHRVNYAAGFGGQFIYVIPDMQMVVVITSKILKEYYPDYILNNFILPAAEVIP